MIAAILFIAALCFYATGHKKCGTAALIVAALRLLLTPGFIRPSYY